MRRLASVGYSPELRGGSTVPRVAVTVVECAFDDGGESGIARDAGGCNRRKRGVQKDEGVKETAIERGRGRHDGGERVLVPHVCYRAERRAGVVEEGRFGWRGCWGLGGF
jgi:hypothetical protein